MKYCIYIMFVLDYVWISIRGKFQSFYCHLGFHLATAVKLRADVASLVKIIKICYHGAIWTREIEFCLEMKTR